MLLSPHAEDLMDAKALLSSSALCAAPYQGTYPVVCGEYGGQKINQAQLTPTKVL